MNLAMLREELPEWSWRAVRSGWGWRYEGHRGAQRITLYAVGVHCGPAEDDFTTQWRTHETGETYATWYVRERMRLRAEEEGRT